MKILVLVPGYLPGFKSGGPVRTIENMINVLADSHQFSVICSDRDIGDQQCYDSIVPNSWSKIGFANVLHISSDVKSYWLIFRVLRSCDFDVLHINSFFSFKFSILPVLLRFIRIYDRPILLGPRGEFSKGALAIKAVKKKTFVAFAKIFRVYSDVVWHASTNYEREDILNAMGLNVSVRVAQDISTAPELPALTQRLPDSPLRVVFLSRISPKKNLLGAITILSKVSVPIEFTIFGPVEDAVYWAKCLDLISRLPSNITCRYEGVLPPSLISSTLAGYDLFLFPTHGENYGHVIAEALFAGLPVLTSDQTPWQHLEANSAGWSLSIDDESSFVGRIIWCFEMKASDYLIWRQRIQQWARVGIVSQAVLTDNRTLFDNLR